MTKRAIEELLAGRFVKNREPGNSMTPLLLSRQEVTLAPVKRPLQKDDIVLCKVNGNIYTHKVTAVRNNEVQISNNHGHVNGWTAVHNVYGLVIEIDGLPFKPSRNKDALEEFNRARNQD